MAPPGTHQSGRAASVAHYRPSLGLIQPQQHRLLGSLHTNMSEKRQKTESSLPEYSEREAFHYRFVCTISAHVRVRHVRVHTPWNGPSCGMLFSTICPVSYADLQ